MIPLHHFLHSLLLLSNPINVTWFYRFWDIIFCSHNVKMIALSSHFLQHRKSLNLMLDKLVECHRVACVHLALLIQPNLYITSHGLCKANFMIYGKIGFLQKKQKRARSKWCYGYAYIITYLLHNNLWYDA